MVIVVPIENKTTEQLHDILEYITANWYRPDQDVQVRRSYRVDSLIFMRMSNWFENGNYSI